MEKELKDFTYRKDSNSYKNKCKDCIAREKRIKRNGNDFNGFIPRSVNPDARYNFDMENIKALNPLPKPKRCRYCRRILSDYQKGLFYCDEICRDAEWVEKASKHICQDCGTIVDPFLSRTGTDILLSMYPKYCPICKIKNKKPRAKYKHTKEFYLKRKIKLSKENSVIKQG